MVDASIVMRGRALARRFGGVLAVDRVSLDLARGAIHAVIGPNGAGKSTLVDLLSGELSPSAGSVELAGTDVTLWPQPRRARAGVGRSYQRTAIFSPFTVLENCRLAAQANEQRPWAWWENAQRARHTLDAGRHAAVRAGLGDVLDEAAASLSHGEQRQLEIAMCLATRPQVLLLDEPLAGMGASESEHMLELIAELKYDHAVLLIEHDMDAVFRLADRLTVMVNGAVIASGAPPAVREDRAVQAAYLGHKT